MVARLNYWEEITAAQAKSKVNSLKPKSKTTFDCWLKSSGLNNDGYAQVSMPVASKRSHKHGSKMLLLHVVAFRSKVNKKPPEGTQVSHLCHHRNCYNPSHLVAESPKKNNERKGCPGTIECTGCNVVFHHCRHSPKCISIVATSACCKTRGLKKTHTV